MGDSERGEWVLLGRCHGPGGRGRVHLGDGEEARISTVGDRREHPGAGQYTGARRSRHPARRLRARRWGASRASPLRTGGRERRGGRVGWRPLAARSAHHGRPTPDARRRGTSVALHRTLPRSGPKGSPRARPRRRAGVPGRPGSHKSRGVFARAVGIGHGSRVGGRPGTHG